MSQNKRHEQLPSMCFVDSRQALIIKQIEMFNKREREREKEERERERRERKRKRGKREKEKERGRRKKNRKERKRTFWSIFEINSTVLLCRKNAFEKGYFNYQNQFAKRKKERERKKKRKKEGRERKREERPLDQIQFSQFPSLYLHNKKKILILLLEVLLFFLVNFLFFLFEKTEIRMINR